MLGVTLNQMSTFSESPLAGAPRQPKSGSQRVSFDVRYKVLRNQLRKFNLQSVVEEALRMTSDPPDDVIDALRQFPWLPMLLAKWALLDKMVLSQIGEPLSPERLRRFVQELWDFERDLIKQASPGTAHLLIRPRVFVQVEFQRGKTRGFVRIPALLSRLPADHSFRKLFQTQWELTPEQFVDLSLALYAARLQDNTPGFHRGFFAPLAGQYGDVAIDRILEMFSQDLNGLRRELTSAETLEDRKGLKPRRRSELLEFPWFKRFPLFKATNDVYFWPCVAADGGLCGNSEGLNSSGWFPAKCYLPTGQKKAI